MYSRISLLGDILPITRTYLSLMYHDVVFMKFSKD